MDPNEGKKFNPPYMQTMMHCDYSGDLNHYMPPNYPHIPSAPINPPSQPRIPIAPYMKPPQSTMPYASTPQSNGTQAEKAKGKRRSKNETVGRDYKCAQCDKTYLSYPALYTHIKTKHSNHGDTPITSARGRGRPRKNVNKDNHVDPNSIFYFHTNERKGGPTAVIYGFKEAFDLLFATSRKYKGYEEHKLYIELYKRHIENVKVSNYSREHPGTIVFGKKPEGLPEAIYELKSEEQPANQQADAMSSENNEEQAIDDKTREENQRKKKAKRCDEIFAEYLDLIAKDTNKKCYANVLKFVFLYRECMNQFGERTIRTKSNGESNVQEMKVEEGKENYCLTNDAEQVPEASNEFVTNYLENAKTSFDGMDPIDLTQNFCGWLFNGGYTCSKLSLMNDN
jgi:hypothetical protein